MSKLIALLGLMCGTLTGVMAVLYNPFAETTLPVGSSGSLYAWSPLEFHGAELGSTELLGLPLGDDTGSPFADQSLSAANAAIVVVRNGNGEAAALATRLVMSSGEGSVLDGNVGADVHMTVFLPNRGSLYLTGYENRWPLLRSEILSTVGRSVASSWTVSVRGPAERAGRIVGGSGGMSGSSGSFRELLELSTAADGSLTGQVELDLAFR